MSALITTTTTTTTGRTTGLGAACVDWPESNPDAERGPDQRAPRFFLSWWRPRFV